MSDYPEEGEIPSLIEIIKQARKASSLGDFPPDERTIEKTLRDCMGAPHVYLRVVRVSGVIRGLICGVLTPSPDLAGDTASDIFFYVDPKYRGRGIGLLKGFLSWAFGFKSVQYVALQISIGGDEAGRTEHLYRRLGFQKTGASFVVRRST